MSAHSGDRSWNEVGVAIDDGRSNSSGADGGNVLSGGGSTNRIEIRKGGMGGMRRGRSRCGRRRRSRNEGGGVVRVGDRSRADPGIPPPRLSQVYIKFNCSSNCYDDVCKLAFAVQDP